MSTLSSFTSRYDDNQRSHIIYNNNHALDVLYNNGSSIQRNLLFTLMSSENTLKLKLRDVSEHLFNYTALIDWSVFDRMKRDQCLDICYDELQLQIVELLKQASSKQLLIKVEVDGPKCRIIFYEKARIKALILLTIDLELTNQKELLDEMSHTITQLKEFNKSVSTQLTVSNNQLRDSESLLKNAVNKSSQIEKQFRKDLELILQTFLSHICQIEANISLEIAKLTKRHQKLLRDVEIVKSENALKCESSERLIQSMQNLRIDSERNNKTLHDFKNQIENLNVLKNNAEQTCQQLHRELTGREAVINNLEKQMAELKRDNEDAAMIIAQKTRTNDEIAKDLIQANQMLVNFNSDYNLLSKQADELKEKLVYKEKVIIEQGVQFEKLNREFEQYRSNYNMEDFKQLHHDIIVSRQRIEELEKQNKEAVKLNGLLTKKLSATDILDSNRFPRKL